MHAIIIAIPHAADALTAAILPYYKCPANQAVCSAFCIAELEAVFASKQLLPSWPGEDVHGACFTKNSKNLSNTVGGFPEGLKHVLVDVIHLSFSSSGWNSANQTKGESHC